MTQRNSPTSRFQSTHPAWGGTRRREKRGLPELFQSTHPAWGGTRSTSATRRPLPNFNPPTPRGVGRNGLSARGTSLQISIHPPRVGWDSFFAHPRSKAKDISIHPPRVGWDTNPLHSFLRWTFQSTHPAWGGTVPMRSVWIPCGYFNPPTPRGVGQRLWSMRRKPIRFQSTHPAWGGTAEKVIVVIIPLHFNPPTPRGVGPPPVGVIRRA